MIEFMVVRDESMPAGHDWVQVDFSDGDTAVFLAKSGAVVQDSEPITVNGVTFQSVPSNRPFEWEWCRMTLADGSERVLFNRDGTAGRLGYVQCENDGTPVPPLRLVA